MRPRGTVLRILWLAGVVTTAACAANPHPAPAAGAAPERELTVGLVQREVHTGTTGAEVATALGSPNLVTRDRDGREVWVYDRVASERTETIDSGTAVGAVAGTNGTVTGVVAGHASHKKTRETSSQKTLTVVIRFDGESRVNGVTFHSTRF